MSSLGATFDALADVPRQIGELVATVRGLGDRLAALEARIPPAVGTVEQAAEHLGVSVPTIRRWIRDGRLPCIRRGRTVRVDLTRVRGIDGQDVADAAVAARGGGR